VETTATDRYLTGREKPFATKLISIPASCFVRPQGVDQPIPIAASTRNACVYFDFTTVIWCGVFVAITGRIILIFVATAWNL
jgi:hypothetical protein